MSDSRSGLPIISLCTNWYRKFLSGDPKESGNLNCPLRVYKEVTVCSSVGQGSHRDTDSIASYLTIHIETVSPNQLTEVQLAKANTFEPQVGDFVLG